MLPQYVLRRKRLVWEQDIQIHFCVITSFSTSDGKNLFFYVVLVILNIFKLSFKSLLPGHSESKALFQAHVSKMHLYEVSLCFLQT